MCVQSYHNLCWPLANAHAVQMIPQQSACTVSTVLVSSAVVSGYLQQAVCRWAEYRYSAGQRNSCHCGKSGGSVSCLGKAPVISGNKGCTENLKLAHALSPLPHRTICVGKNGAGTGSGSTCDLSCRLLFQQCTCLVTYGRDEQWTHYMLQFRRGSLIPPHENKQDEISIYIGRFFTLFIGHAGP